MSPNNILCWNLTREERAVKKLEAAHYRWIEKILGISGKDEVRKYNSCLCRKVGRYFERTSFEMTEHYVSGNRTAKKAFFCLMHVVQKSVCIHWLFIDNETQHEARWLQLFRCARCPQWQEMLTAFSLILDVLRSWLRFLLLPALCRFLSLEPQERNPFLSVGPVEMKRVENVRMLSTSRNSVGL